MRRCALSYLACPRCEGELNLIDFNEHEGEVVSGVISCGRYGRTYVIRNGLPDLTVRERLTVSNRISTLAYNIYAPFTT
ncbi:MAG: Trm112 family protein [Candidatus Freyarchaeota archaeon]|nr:Trm112 family protein [Candidatus Freyrarchaeum guaymaensis]